MNPFDKSTLVASLNVEQFTALMTSINETKGYLAAKREQEVTERIFKDAEGLIIAGVVPFRVKTIEDAQDFANTLIEHYKKDGTGTFAIAAALLVDYGRGDTGYHKLP